MILKGDFVRTLSKGSLSQAVQRLDKGMWKYASQALLSVFDWSKSPEGFTVWQKAWGALHRAEAPSPALIARLKLYLRLVERSDEAGEAA